MRSQYHLNQMLATLLPFTVFIAFAGFSVPGGLLAARIGKKRLLMLGLATCALGVGVPVLMTPGFVLLLGCIFLLGIGTTFLQVAANPLMRDVSPVGNYGRNLALARGVKDLGSSGSAWLVGAVSVIPLLAGLGWRGAFPLFLAITAGRLTAGALGGNPRRWFQGSALVPLAMGALRDAGLNGASFLVPLIGFLYLLFLSLDDSRSAG